MAELVTVYVTHDFEAENEDEIPLKAGETVLVIEKDEEFQDGWWRGRNVHGEIGLFPMNYTSAVPPKATLLEKSIGSLEDAISAMQVTPLPPIPAEEAAPSPGLEKDTTAVIEKQPEHSTPSGTTGPSSHSKSPDSVGTRSSSIKPAALPSASRSNLHCALGASLALPSLKDTIPEDWTIEQVVLWLEAMGFKDVVDTFKNQEITGDVLIDLTPESLKELDIGTFGKRHKLFSAIQALHHEITNGNRTSIEVPPTAGLSLYVPNSNESTASGSQRHTDDGFDFPAPPTATAPRGFNASAPVSAPLTTQRFSPDLERRLLHSPLPEIPVQYTLKQTVGMTNTMPINSGLNARDHQDEDDPSAQNTMRSNGRSSFLRGSFLGSSNNKYGGIFSGATNRNSVDIAARQSTTIEERGRDGKAKNDMEGWLHKQGDKYRTWNKRWFVLQGHSLYYFKSPKDLRVKGIINLDGYRVINDESIHPGSYCFKLQHDRERTFFFYTDSDQSMKSWMRALMKATISRNYSTPVLSSSTVPTISLESARRMRPRPPSMIMQTKDDLSFLGKRYNAPAESNRPHSSLSYINNSSLPPIQSMRASRSEGVASSLRQPPPSLTRSISNSPSVRSHNKHYGAPNNTQLGTMFDVPEEDEDMIDPRRDFIRVSNGWKSSNPGQSPPPSSTATRDAPFDYIQWVNQHAKDPVTSLDQLRSGEILIDMLENISGKAVRRPMQSTSDSMRMLDTIVAAFKFMGREGIRIDGSFTIKDIIGGNEKKIKLLLDEIRIWKESQPMNGNHGYMTAANF